MTLFQHDSLLRLSLILGFGFTIALSGAVPAECSDSLETAIASFEPAAIERVFDGAVEAVHQATVSAQTGGRIAELNYDVDDFVEVGAVLVRFTDEEQKAALRQAEAQFAEARARSTEAGEDYRRALNLKQRGAGSQRDLDRALAAQKTAEARVTAGESTVAAAQQKLDYTTVTAPFSGIVTERHVELGETISPGHALLSGLSLEHLRVAVDLPQSVATEVRKNPVAAVITSEGRVETGNITLFPVADPVTNTFRVRLELPEGQFGLYPGMFVKVVFAIGESERLLVPSEAVLHRSEVTAVYVVSPEGVRLRQVRNGQEFGDRVEILSGLKAGEAVALDPVRAGIVTKRDPGSSHD